MDVGVWNGDGVYCSVGGQLWGVSSGESLIVMRICAGFCSSLLYNFAPVYISGKLGRQAGLFACFTQDSGSGFVKPWCK